MGKYAFPLIPIPMQDTENSSANDPIRHCSQCGLGSQWLANYNH